MTSFENFTIQLLRDELDKFLVEPSSAAKKSAALAAKVTLNEVCSDLAKLFDDQSIFSAANTSPSLDSPGLGADDEDDTFSSVDGEQIEYETHELREPCTETPTILTPLSGTFATPSNEPDDKGFYTFVRNGFYCTVCDATRTKVKRNVPRGAACNACYTGYRRALKAEADTSIYCKAPVENCGNCDVSFHRGWSYCLTCGAQSPSSKGSKPTTMKALTRPKKKTKKKKKKKNAPTPVAAKRKPTTPTARLPPRKGIDKMNADETKRDPDWDDDNMDSSSSEEVYIPSRRKRSKKAHK